MYRSDTSKQTTAIHMASHSCPMHNQPDLMLVLDARGKVYSYRRRTFDCTSPPDRLIDVATTLMGWKRGREMVSSNYTKPRRTVEDIVATRSMGSWLARSARSFLDSVPNPVFFSFICKRSDVVCDPLTVRS